MAAIDEAISYANQARNKAVGIQYDCTNVINRLNTVVQQMAALETENTALENEILELNTDIAILEAQVVDLQNDLAECQGGNPPPPPGFWQGLSTDWDSIKANVGPRIATVAASGGNVSGLIQGKRFTSTVYPADGTVFEDCEFVGNGGWGIDGEGKIFTVENCKFTSTNGGPAAILGTADVFYCDISGFEDGIKTQGDGWIIRGNWIHGPYAGGADPHNDAVQVQFTNSNGLIEMNVIEWRDTSEVFLQELTGQISNVTVRWNLMQGSDLPLRIEGGTENCKAYENAIKQGNWGYFDLASNVEHYGNIDAVTGAALD